MNEAVEHPAATDAAPPGSGGHPFESATELRDAHEALLLRLDELLSTDSSEQAEADALSRLETPVRAFLARGAATGAFLEEVRDRTACQVLLDYWVSALARIGHGVMQTRLARFDREQLPDLSDKPCPYVGLEAFRADTYFFGRAADTRKLVDHVRKHPLTIVAGASGSGKSSLVMGGLLPALKEAGDSAGWLQLPPFTPGDDAPGHLAAAFAAVLPRSDSTAGQGAIALEKDPEEFARSILSAAQHPLVVTIDQFEEVFTLSSSSERDALARCLAHLLAADKGHRVVLTVREEFSARVGALAPLQPFIEDARYEISPLGYAELRQAIEKPAAMVNLEFQGGIADDLAKKVLGQPAALPLLQFTLQRLWQARDRNRITREVYDKVGSPLEALKKTADGFLAGLAPQTADEVKRVLLELVRVDELLEAYRQPVRRAALLAAGKANTTEVLELLARMDYVSITAGSDKADPVVEIKHEALIRNWPQLVAWIDEKRLQRRLRVAISEAAQRWSDNHRSPEGLLTSWQLEEAKKFADLSRIEQDFVAESARAIDRAETERASRIVREHRKTLIIAGACVGCVLLAGATAWYMNASNELKERARVLQESEIRLQQANERLAKREADLKYWYDYLYNVAQKSKEAQTPVKPGTAQPIKVFLHISRETQRAQAQDIAARLRTSKVQVDKGIQLVQKFPNETEVRYFRPDDKPVADEIARSLGSLTGEGASASTKLVKGFETIVPERQVEVWFAPSTLGAKAEPQVAPVFKPAVVSPAPVTAPPPPPPPVAQAPVPSAPSIVPTPPPAASTVPPKPIVDSRMLEKGQYTELPAVFGGKPLWIYVNRAVDANEMPTVIIFDRAPPGEYKEATAHLFRSGLRRGTQRPLDKNVGPGKFSEPFTYGGPKYRLTGEVSIGRGIQFEVFAE